MQPSQDSNRNANLNSNLNAALNPSEARAQMQAWEAHMISHIPGRQSAFDLCAELLFHHKPSESLHLADLGCGFGGWSVSVQAAAQARNLEFQFTALDASAPRLAVYQTLIGPDARLLQGDFLKTIPELEDAALDAVFFGWAAHEIPMDQLQQVYAGIHRALKPGGLLLIADFMSGLKPPIEALAREMTRTRRAAIMADPERRKQEQALHDHAGHGHGHHHHGQNQEHHHGHGHGQHHAHGSGHRHEQADQPAHQAAHQHANVRHYAPEEHVAFLSAAGFGMVEEVWRYLNSRLLLAIKA